MAATIQSIKGKFFGSLYSRPTSLKWLWIIVFPAQKDTARRNGGFKTTAELFFWGACRVQVCLGLVAGSVRGWWSLAWHLLNHFWVPPSLILQARLDFELKKQACWRLFLPFPGLCMSTYYESALQIVTFTTSINRKYAFDLYCWENYDRHSVSGGKKLGKRKHYKEKLRRQWKPLPTLSKEEEPHWYRVPYNSSTNHKRIVALRLRSLGTSQKPLT
jgi:hypothetical protein